MFHFFVVAGLLTSGVSPWTVVDDTDVERIEVKQSSIQPVRGLEQAGGHDVRKVDLRITPKNNAYASAGLDVTHVEATILTDCQKPLYLAVSMTARGGVNDGQKWPVDPNWSDYKIGSTEDKITKLVCGK